MYSHSHNIHLGARGIFNYMHHNIIVALYILCHIYKNMADQNGPIQFGVYTCTPLVHGVYSSTIPHLPKNICHPLQGHSTKIITGQAIDDVTQTRGAGGMPPRKSFEI